MFLIILDVFHRRILSPSQSVMSAQTSTLPYPIVRMPGASLAIKIGKRFASSIDDVDDLLIVPRIPELPINRTQRIDEVEKNNWILALAAISFDAIWFTSKIWKRITERCGWSPAQKSTAAVSENFIIPRAIVNFFHMIAIIGRGDDLPHASPNVFGNASPNRPPSHISELLEFMCSSGLVGAFAHLSSFTKFFDEIEYFWERHAKE